MQYPKKLQHTYYYCACFKDIVSHMIKGTHACGLFYKHITTINDDSSIINKFETSLTNNARVVIYNCHMFIIQATDLFVTYLVQKGNSKFKWHSLKTPV